jgi:hypothetical protein
LPVQSPKGQRVSAYTDMQRISSFTKDWNNLHHHHLEVRREQRKRHLIVDGRSHASASRDILTYTRLFKGPIYYISIHARHDTNSQ